MEAMKSLAHRVWTKSAEMIKLVLENTPTISVSQSEAFKREEGYHDIQEQSAEYQPPTQSPGLTLNRQQQNSGDQTPGLDGTVEILCKQCQQIDFGALLDLACSKPEALNVGHVKLNFPVEHEHPETCVLCAFVAEIAKNAYFSYATPRTLRVCSVSEIEEASTVRRWIDSNGSDADEAFYFRLLAEGSSCTAGEIVQVGFDAPSPWPKLSLALSSSSTAASFLDNEPTTRDFFLRSVELKLENPNLIKQLLDTCSNQHECLKQQVLVPAVGISAVLNVIDCQEQKVITAPVNCEYLALSYVWGREEVLPFERRPQVVQDAMAVTLQLGQRFLWVDKYCILTDDKDLKQYQLNQMDQVYSSAFATVVAAAGKSEDYGLCGISRPRINAQPNVRLPGTDGMRLIGEIRGTKKAIYDSVWMSRAWTLQEGLCSKRLIIFSENEVYFECGAMRCHEHTRLVEGKTGEWCEPLLGVGGRSMIPDYSDPLQNFWHTVQDYSRRHLTYDRDAMNAVRGILHRFRKPPSITDGTARVLSTFFGIPLEKQDVKDDDAYHTLMIRDGLCWKHTRDTSRRRVDFPSWTWAGWNGLIYGPWSSRIETSLQNGALIWVQLKNGQRKPCDYLCHSSQGEIDNSFDCLGVSMQLVSIKLSMLREAHRMFKGITGTAPHSIPHRDLGCADDAADVLWDIGLLNTDQRYKSIFIILLRWMDEEKTRAERLWGGWVSKRALPFEWSEPRTFCLV